MKAKYVIPAMVVGSLFSGIALAETDAENTARIERELAERIALTDDSVRVVNINGRMELVGTVESYADAEVAMLAAADEFQRDSDGIVQIRNSLTILEPLPAPLAPY